MKLKLLIAVLTASIGLIPQAATAADEATTKATENAAIAFAAVVDAKMDEL